MKYLFSLAVISALFIPIKSFGQTSSGATPYFSFKRGIAVTAPDSSFSVNFRFRMQNRAVYTTNSTEDLSASEIEARVRRLRLRIEGFMYNPKLTYMIQLSFSRGDMDWSVRHGVNTINESPNVVRDAVIYYRPVKGLTLFFGQTKLPGNRQRVVSSGDLQFIDRSIVNATFNIDRDFGFQTHYLGNLGKFHYMVKGALTSGEGRNVILTNGGLAYTGRIELLPLGLFKNNGDYFEGDLEREETVKVSLAGGLSFNERARRSGGQIGRDLHEMRTIETYIFDGLVKYRGFAVYGEYIERKTGNPFTFNSAGDRRHIISGNGKMIQGSYNFINNFELAMRYANIRPESRLRDFEYTEDVYTVGVTKYLRAHRLKLQSNFSFHQQGRTMVITPRDFLSLGFQMELGI
ncbi:MAG: porin [Cytophagaceae bacterium]